MRIVDLYLGRLMVRAYASILGLVILALTIETLPRLLARSEGVDERGTLVLLSLASLVPEYVAVGVPIALFLATFWAFRRLTLMGELDALMAAGCSHWRLARLPLLLGLASAVLVIGLRGYGEPAGERGLDTLARLAAAGAFGFRIEPGLSHELAGGTRLFFTRVAGRPDILRGVFIEAGPVTIVAAEARLRFAESGGLMATIARGHVVRRTRAGAPAVARFDRLRVALPEIRASIRVSSSRRDRLDRMDLPALLASSSPRAGIDAGAARASATARVAAGLLCPLLPLLAFVLGVPPKRSRSAIGLGAGLGAILIFWKASALFEDHYAPAALALHAALLGAFAAAALWLIRFQAREGPGAVEASLSAAAGSVAKVAADLLGSGRTATARLHRSPLRALRR